MNFDGSGLIWLYQAHESDAGDAMSLDLTGNKMYLSDGEGSTNKIMRTNLDGSDAEELMVLPAPYTFVGNIALNITNDKMYLSVVDSATASTKDCAVLSANLDGSNIETLYTWTASTSGKLLLVISQ